MCTCFSMKNKTRPSELATNSRLATIRIKSPRFVKDPGAPDFRDASPDNMYKSHAMPSLYFKDSMDSHVQASVSSPILFRFLSGADAIAH